MDLGVMLNMPDEKLIDDGQLKDRILKELEDCEIDEEFKQMLHTAVMAKEIKVESQYCQPKGMAFINHGAHAADRNTCYISSLLNALVNVPSIKKIIMDHQSLTYENAILECLAKYLTQSSETRRTVQDFKKVIAHLTAVNREMNVYRKNENQRREQRNLEITDESQQLELLEYMPETTLVGSEQEDPQELLQIMIQNCEPLEKALTTQVRTMTKCSNCRTVQWSPFNSNQSKLTSIQIPCSENRDHTFADLLALHQKEEEITKICHACKKNGIHCKKVVPHKAAPILAFELKRWVIDLNNPIRQEDGSFQLSASGQKTYHHKKITWPIKLASKIRYGGKSYQLVSVISHLSTNAINGHYIANLWENSPFLTWTITNDNHIIPASPDDPDQGYIYFYQQMAEDEEVWEQVSNLGSGVSDYGDVPTKEQHNNCDANRDNYYANDDNDNHDPAQDVMMDIDEWPFGDDDPFNIIPPPTDFGDHVEEPKNSQTTEEHIFKIPEVPPLKPSDSTTSFTNINVMPSQIHNWTSQKQKIDQKQQLSTFNAFDQIKRAHDDKRWQTMDHRHTEGWIRSIPDSSIFDYIKTVVKEPKVSENTDDEDHTTTGDEVTDTDEEVGQVNSKSGGRKKKNVEKPKKKSRRNQKLTPEEIQTNIDNLKKIRAQGIKNLNKNQSNVSDLFDKNPVLEAGLKFEEEMKNKFVMSETCQMCHGADYDFYVGNYHV